MDISVVSAPQNVPNFSCNQENSEDIMESETTHFVETNSVRTSKEEAQEALNGIYAVLQKHIIEGDPSILSRIMKVKKKLEKQSRGQLGNALHCFGNKFTSSNAIKKHEKSRLRKGRIPVGVEAVKRRKDGQVKSERPLPKGPTSHFNLKSKTNYTKKREHNFTRNLAENVVVAKKAGRSMDSKTKPTLKKRKLKDC